MISRRRTLQPTRSTVDIDSVGHAKSRLATFGVLMDMYITEFNRRADSS